MPDGKEAKAEIKELKETKKELNAEIKEAKAEVKKASAAKLAISREVELELAGRIITVMTTALAVVAGLFWQTAINDTIKTFIPVSGAWQYEIGVALGVTVLAAATIYFLGKYVEKLQKVRK